MTLMAQFRETLKHLPFMRTVGRALGLSSGFRSNHYWKSRYRRQGNSGSGSYGRLSEFKAGVLNEFVREYRIQNVIEWGCGDGNQLALAEYPQYTGVDISKDAIELCRRRFRGDSTRKFILDAEAERLAVKADLAVSLDVIYHLVEDAVFESYMRALIGSADRFVGIYSSDRDEIGPAPHVRHRSFSNWMAQNAPDWEAIRFVGNLYPYDPANPDQTSWANFKFYRRSGTDKRTA